MQWVKYKYVNKIFIILHIKVFVINKLYIHKNYFFINKYYNNPYKIAKGIKKSNTNIIIFEKINFKKSILKEIKPS